MIREYASGIAMASFLNKKRRKRELSTARNIAIPTVASINFMIY